MSTRDGSDLPRENLKTLVCSLDYLLFNLRGLTKNSRYYYLHGEQDNGDKWENERDWSYALKKVMSISIKSAYDESSWTKRDAILLMDLINCFDYTSSYIKGIQKEEGNLRFDL